MLATATLGAIWTSCSPDFGADTVLDRIGQVEPAVLFAVDGYAYGGKEFDTRDRLAAIVDRIPSLKRVVVVPHLEEAPSIRDIPRAAAWQDVLGEWAPGDIQFERFAFDHPLYIVYDPFAGVGPYDHVDRLTAVTRAL